MVFFPFLQYDPSLHIHTNQPTHHCTIHTTCNMFIWFPSQSIGMACCLFFVVIAVSVMFFSQANKPPFIDFFICIDRLLTTQTHTHKQTNSPCLHQATHPPIVNTPVRQGREHPPNQNSDQSISSNSINQSQPTNQPSKRTHATLVLNIMSKP